MGSTHDYEIDVRNENLAHISKSPEGVLLSSSMQDYEPLIYKKTAMCGR